MPQYTYDEQTANEATGFSAFGGHLLTPGRGLEATPAAAGHVATLASLGIEDAEQLVATAAVPGAREELQSVLGLRDREFQALVDRAVQSLPAQRAALVSEAVPADLGLGVLPPTQEMMEAAATSAEEIGVEAVALPASVNLISFMSAIRNQASRGTCVGFALTALNEYILRRRGRIVDVSEQHLYYEAKQIDGASGACGTWQVKAVIALRNSGECRETIWPYNPSLPCNNHGARPPQARPDGLNYRLATLQVPARNVLAYKTHMSSQRPVTLSIPVYNSWYQSAETRRSGRITMRIGQEPAVGGHAVCLVGYQDTPASPGGGYFLVRNSWHTTWAYQSPYGAGYGTIPYQYIANDAMEAFTAVVPGIQEEDQPADDEQPEEASTVTIQVGRNVKITISSR